MPFILPAIHAPRQGLILTLGAMLLVLAMGQPAHADDVSPFKECATLRNTAHQSVMGVIRTAAYKFKGQTLRHEANFVLEDGEFVEICSTGPFYDGYKVSLTIRSLIPLFSCKTRLSGEIVIRRREDENGYKILYVDCK